MIIEQHNTFNNWPGNPLKVEYLSQFEAARAAWEAALGQLDRAKDEVCVEIRANLMALAVQCFRDKEDDQAEFFRNLADELHIIWSK